MAQQAIGMIETKGLCALFEATDADYYGVKAGDSLKLRVGGPWEVTLDKMLVRVDKSYKLEVHIDTDEGNACNLQPDTPCELLK